MKIVLSICIATYNRAGFIGATLESIIPQLEKGVELLVVDGASPDRTEEVVRRYQMQSPQLRYVGLPVKGGVDQDYDRTVELAEGEYCWLFTDDDLLKPGAVKAVLDAIGQNYSLVVVNAEIRNADLSRQLAERKVAAKSDRVYEDNAVDKERFLVDAGDYLSFIGGVVINRKLWLLRNRPKYYGSSFIHVGVIFQSPLPGKILLMATPWIVIRLGVAEWTSRRLEIWMFNWPELIWSFGDYSDASKRVVCRQYPWQRLRTLIFYRALGVYSLDKYSRLLKERLHLSWKQVLMGMIARMPVSVARSVARVYCLVRQNKVMLYVLQSSLPIINKK